jgi:hypothetical protein
MLNFVMHWDDYIAGVKWAEHMGEHKEIEPYIEIPTSGYT